MESVLPEVSLSQHRDQDARNRRATFRVFASTNVKRACRPETILSKPLFRGSTFALAANELFNAAVRFVVGHLHRRTFRKIRGGRVKCTTDPAVERQFATTNRVDDDASRIGRVLDRKFEVELHRDIAEDPAFNANETNLIVALPWDEIAGADMNVFVGQPFSHDRLHRFGLRSLL